MTKADIVNSVSEATGLTKVETEAVLEGILQSIASSLKKGERIDIRGFGSFRLKKSNARKARNPKTGESIYVNEKKGIHFKMGKTLTKIINNKNE